MSLAGQHFVFSAPSGAGKSTIISALRKRVKGFGYSVSHTTRKPRGNERDGIDYHFVDRETFEQMIEAGAFVEWAKVYNELYGTSFSGIKEQTASGRDVLLDLDTQGGKNIKKHFEDSILIYILPPSLEILEERLKERGTDDGGTIRYRMKEASREIGECVWYDYIIINDELEKVIEEAKAIVLSERCRTRRKLPEVKRLFDLSTL